MSDIKKELLKSIRNFFIDAFMLCYCLFVALLLIAGFMQRYPESVAEYQAMHNTCSTQTYSGQ